jgi:hypothetical protein
MLWEKKKMVLPFIFCPNLTSRHIILHVSAYLCDTYPQSHVSADVANIYIY